MERQGSPNNHPHEGFDQSTKISRPQGGGWEEVKISKK